MEREVDEVVSHDWEWLVILALQQNTFNARSCLSFYYRWNTLPESERERDGERAFRAIAQSYQPLIRPSQHIGATF